MKSPSVKTVRCAIYTRVSTEHGLDQEFNSLDARAQSDRKQDGRRQARQAHRLAAMGM
jgi:hypothetical protein